MDIDTWMKLEVSFEASNYAMEEFPLSVFWVFVNEEEKHLEREIKDEIKNFGMKEAKRILYEN